MNSLNWHVLKFKDIIAKSNEKLGVVSKVFPILYFYLTNVLQM
jgi:hypothetical protein